MLLAYVVPNMLLVGVSRLVIPFFNVFGKNLYFSLLFFFCTLWLAVAVHLVVSDTRLAQTCRCMHRNKTIPKRYYKPTGQR
jgi:hypothetical protein